VGMNAQTLEDFLVQAKQYADLAAPYRASIPGALGIWKEWFGWTNLKWIGFVEGAIFTALATLIVWGLMPQGPPHAVYHWLQSALHVPTYLAFSLAISLVT